MKTLYIETHIDTIKKLIKQAVDRPTKIRALLFALYKVHILLLSFTPFFFASHDFHEICENSRGKKSRFFSNGPIYCTDSSLYTCWWETSFMKAKNNEVRSWLRLFLSVFRNTIILLLSSLLAQHCNRQNIRTKKFLARHSCYFIFFGR